MAAVIFEGNLLDAHTKYIAHQTNCVTNKAAHLAAAVFARYPHADVYSGRVIYDEPGTIIVKGNGEDERLVINMFGQFYPGKPRYADSAKDGYFVRRKYFFSCLKEVSLIDDLDSIAFPWGIGCGAAGGDWDFYHGLIDKFAEHMKYKADVFIYKLPEIDK
jgi:hypothetical protein